MMRSSEVCSTTFREVGTLRQSFITPAETPASTLLADLGAVVFQVRVAENSQSLFGSTAFQFVELGAYWFFLG